MVKFLRAHVIFVYFTLTFLLSWLIWVPLALDYLSLLPLKLDAGFVSIVRLFGTLGPAVSAILASFLAGGGPGVKSLLGQLKRWRVKWTWYVAAGLVFPALIFVVAWIYRLLPGVPALPIQPISVAGLIITVIILTISVTGEEIGWRGFALPQLQKQSTALKASLVLGTIHTLWHLPFWLILGELERFGWGYWVLSWIWIMAITIYITWIMNNTGSSLPMVLLFHWSLNVVSVGYLPITTVIPAYIIFIVIAGIIDIGLLVRYGSKRLVRASKAAIASV
jgi:membrane protease YdiL (CAAX protease family)